MNPTHHHDDPAPSVIETAGKLAVQRSAAVAETGRAWVWDLGTVTRDAMREIQRITADERSLSAETPAAAAGLRMVRDLAAAHLAAIVTATARALLPEESGA